MEYIGHDGSRGRLFYDLARSCKFLHPPASVGSTSVPQRNPFSTEMEMAWQNIVELPFVGDSMLLRSYHGNYIIAKKTGTLGRIRHETRCEVKLCGHEFNVPTKYCDPYVWVIGDQPGQVDRAVKILKEAVEHHARSCHCRFAT